MGSDAVIHSVITSQPFPVPMGTQIHILVPHSQSLQHGEQRARPEPKLVPPFLALPAEEGASDESPDIPGYALSSMQKATITRP